MLVVAVLAVFICGLMVGRTPEFLGKKIGRTEITLASAVILITPTLVLTGTAVATMWPNAADSILNADSPHGLSEILYAFTSAANNNGSAFAGLNANTPFFNTALGLAMLIGRFGPICAVLALAGAFAAQPSTEATPGTLPTHRPLFVGVTVGTGLIVSALTFLPVLALGPINEGLL